MNFDDAAIIAAARVIARGGCVGVPTETVYGLAADATCESAVARIFEAKGRPGFNPLIVHVENIQAAERIAVFDADARLLAARFWPGPLTIVLPVRQGSVAESVTAGLSTVALRVSAHRAMEALLRASGKPLAAPSANASNRISPTRPEHVLATLNGRFSLLIDDGPTTAGVESTIVSGRTILRPGPITAEQLIECLGGVLPAMAKEGQGGEGEPLNCEPPIHVTAPGQLPLHYAPVKPVRLNVTEPAPNEWLIGFGNLDGDDTLSGAGELAEAATRLFDALHRADASDRERIAVAPIPSAGIGSAINDRLRRAAARR